MVAIIISHGAMINLHRLSYMKTWTFMMIAVISCRVY